MDILLKELGLVALSEATQRIQDRHDVININRTNNG